MQYKETSTSIVQRTTRHDTIQHDTTRHHTTQHDTTRHDTTQHDTTRHDTTRHAAWRGRVSMEQNMIIARMRGIRQLALLDDCKMSVCIMSRIWLNFANSTWWRYKLISTNHWFREAWNYWFQTEPLKICLLFVAYDKINITYISSVSPGPHT